MDEIESENKVHNKKYRVENKLIEQDTSPDPLCGNIQVDDKDGGHSEEFPDVIVSPEHESDLDVPDRSDDQNGEEIEQDTRVVITESSGRIEGGNHESSRHE